MADESEYLNLGLAAEVLGVSPRRIRELIRAGQMKAITNPLDRREKLIPRTEIERFSKFVRPSKKEVA